MQSLHASHLSLRALALGTIAVLGFGWAAQAVVYSDAESVEPLAVGASVPSAEVTDLDGKPVDIASLVGEQGALLVFYRGGW
ncbi:MAG: hypothetical protein AAF430_04160 [Myxococcota bacterium]